MSGPGPYGNRVPPIIKLKKARGVANRYAKSRVALAKLKGKPVGASRRKQIKRKAVADILDRRVSDGTGWRTELGLYRVQTKRNRNKIQRLRDQKLGDAPTRRV